MANTGILHRKIVDSFYKADMQSLATIDIAKIAKQNLQHNVLDIVADGRVYIVMFGESQDYYHGNTVLDALCLLASPKQAEIGDCVIESAFTAQNDIWEVYKSCNITTTLDGDMKLNYTTQQFARHSDLFNNTKISYWKRIS